MLIHLFGKFKKKIASLVHFFNKDYKREIWAQERTPDAKIGKPFSRLVSYFVYYL